MGAGSVRSVEVSQGVRLHDAAGVATHAARVAAHPQQPHAGADNVVRRGHRRRAAGAGRHGTSSAYYTIILAIPTYLLRYNIQLK